MNNLTWMYENHDGFNAQACWWAVWEGLAEDDLQADEWLMAERNDTLSPEKAVSDPGGGSNVAYVAQDSREKLEAAAQTAAGYIYGRGFTNGLADAWNDDEVDTAANRIIQLLDRQAAISERECREYEDELREQHHRRVADLTAERDALRIYRDSWERKATVLEGDVGRLVCERDALQAKLDALEAHGVTVSEPFCGGYEVYNERKRQVDELRAELAKRDKGIARLKRRRDELERALEIDSRIRASQDAAVEEIARQRDEARHDLEQAEATCMGQRREIEELRDKLAEAIGRAVDILALQDLSAVDADGGVVA